MKNKLLPILLIACLLLVALAVAFIPMTARNLDVSGGFYEMSEATEAYLTSLEDEITMYVLNSDTKMVKLDVYLKKYAALSDNLTLEYVKSRDTAGILAENGYGDLDAASVAPYSLFVVGERRAELLDFYSLFCYSNSNLGFEEISYSTYNYYLQVFSQNESYLENLNSLVYESELLFYGDSLITRAVEYVALDKIPHVYLAYGHGENDVNSGNLAQILTNMGYGYGSFDITSLHIPSDASSVIINAPASDYTDAETAILMDYLKNGGRLIFVGGQNIKDMPNLSSIADYYGISVSAETVLFEQQDEEETEPTDSFIPNINFDHDIFGGFNANYVPVIKKANPITVKSDLRASQIVTPILTTPSDAYVGSADNKSEMTVGVSIEEETQNGNTRVVWLTGAESYNGAEAQVGNLAVLVYAIDWTDVQYVSVISTLDTVNYEPLLLQIESGKGNSIGVFAVAVVPAIIIFAFAFCMIKRKRA